MNEKTIKYLHISHDNKFLKNRFIPNIKKVANLNQHYFFILNTRDIKFHIKDSAINIKYGNIKELKRFITKNPKLIKIIIHGFTDDIRKIILSVNKSIKVVSIFLGYEFYALIDQKELLKTFSLKFFVENHNIESRSIINILRKRRWNYIVKKSLNRIDFIGHYIFKEIDFLKSKLSIKATYLDFNYGRISQILELKSIAFSGLGNNTLLGNSGSIFNNHLDLIDDLDLNELKSGMIIYCPLSYSITSTKYIEKVIKAGKMKFGKSFVPLTEFTSNEEFNKILIKCNNVVLGHHRSQGGASIWSTLYRGGNLYLSEKNPFYLYLKSMGVTIFKIEDSIDLSIQLSNEQKHRNRNFLIERFNDEIIFNKYKNLIEC